MISRPLLRSSLLCSSLPRSLVLVATTVAMGLVVRFGQLGLPACVVKYAGSMLWAATIYWVVTMAPPQRLVGHGSVWTSAAIAGCVATTVEFFKLYRSPAVDAFRSTLAGVLLLGRYFAWADILAYWIAILLAAMLDRAMRSRG